MGARTRGGGVAYVIGHLDNTNGGTPDETERLWKEVCDGDSRRDGVLNAWRGAGKRIGYRRHRAPPSSLYRPKKLY